MEENLSPLDTLTSHRDGEIVDRSEMLPFTNPCFESYADMFEVQLKSYSRGDKSLESLFSDEFIKPFKASLKMEMQELKRIGFSAYVSTLESERRITPESAELLSYLYTKMDESNKINISAAKEELALFYEPGSVKAKYSDFYCYIYNIAFRIYEQYQAEGILTDRSECTFRDFVQHVFASAAAGAGLGQAVNFVWDDILGLPVVEWEINDNLTITIPGSVIGGAVGAIVGIFTFDDDACEDCGQPRVVAITPDDDCDLTRTLQVVGAGADAAGYEWYINTGNQNISFTTIEPLATVTQDDPSIPLRLQVRAICEDGLSDSSEEQDINLDTQAGSPLGEVGTLDLYFFGCGGPTASMDCLNTSPSSYAIFHYSPSNAGSGHIEIECTVTPASIVAEKNVRVKSASIRWEHTGTATISVTATNTCSGLTTTESISVEITD